MRIDAIECPSCGDVIFSRARHDFHWCSCGEVAIDGGFDYVKISFKKVFPRKLKIDLSVTAEELYFDWAHQKDVHGIIKTLTIEKNDDTFLKQ